MNGIYSTLVIVLLTHIRLKNLYMHKKTFGDTDSIHPLKILIPAKCESQSLNNASIRPKAVSIRPKIHSFDQKPSPWPLMNALQKILLCFKNASNFKTTKGHVNASYYFFIPFTFLYPRKKLFLVICWWFLLILRCSNVILVFFHFHFLLSSIFNCRKHNTLR